MPQKAVDAVKGLAWESPRGPVSIDPESRHITQNIYLREVAKADGRHLLQQGDPDLRKAGRIPAWRLPNRQRKPAFTARARSAVRRQLLAANRSDMNHAEHVFSIAVDALAYGMVLFVISIGLSVTMGLMRVVNLAHGAFAMIGGYIASYAARDLGLGYGVAIVLAVVGTIIIAIPIERLLYRRIYGAPELTQVLMTIGITFCIIGIANYVFGPTLKTIPLPATLQRPGRSRLPLDRRAQALRHRSAASPLPAALWYLIERTAFGVKLRASVDNAAMAAALGVRTKIVYAVSFAVAVGLAAFGGVVGAELLPVEPYYALRYMVTFLVVVSVGGAGSIPGALLACLLLGAIDTTGRYLMPEYRRVLLLSRRDRHRLRLPARPCWEGPSRWRDRNRTLPRPACRAAQLAGARSDRRRRVILALAVVGYFLFPEQSGAADPHHRDRAAGAVARSGDRLLRRGDARPCRAVRRRRLRCRHRCGAFRHHRSARHGRRRRRRRRRRRPGLAAWSSCAATACRNWCCRSRSSTCSMRPPTRRRPGPAAATACPASRPTRSSACSTSISGAARPMSSASLLLVIVFVLLRALVRSPFGMLCRGIKEDPVRVSAPWAPRVKATLIKMYVISGAVAGVGGALNAISTQVVGLDSLSFTTVGRSAGDAGARRHRFALRRADRHRHLHVVRGLRLRRKSVPLADHRRRVADRRRAVCAARASTAPPLTFLTAAGRSRR